MTSESHRNGSKTLGGLRLMGENGSRGQHQLSKERGFVLVNRLYWLIAKV